MTYGRGSIHHRSRDQRWIASVELPRGRGEPRRRKSFVAATYAEAAARLDLYRERHPAAEYPGRAELVARAKALAGSHTSADWWSLVRSVGGICYYCGIKTDCVWTPPDHPRHLQKDHRTPLIRGGSDLIDNLVVSCRSCNAEKCTMTEPEYRTWKASPRG